MSETCALECRQPELSQSFWCGRHWAGRRVPGRLLKEAAAGTKGTSAMDGTDKLYVTIQSVERTWRNENGSVDLSPKQETTKKRG